MIYKNKLKRQIKSNFGKNPLTDCHIYYDGSARIDKIRRLFDSKGKHTKNQIDDITWNDLEMDEVFLRINHCNSFIGEQVLFDRLHSLGEDENFEERIEAFEKDADFRSDVEFHLNTLGKRQEAFYLYEIIKDSNLVQIGSTLVAILLQLLMVAFLGLYIFTLNSAFLGALAIVGCINIVMSFSAKRKYEVIIGSLSYYIQTYNCAKWLMKQGKYAKHIPEDVKASVNNLKGINRLASSMLNRGNAKMLGDMTALLMDYIYGITLIDIVLCNHVMKAIDNKQEDVLKVIEFIGKVDSDIAILSYRNSIELWCKPEKASFGIKSEGLAHPLLSNPVTCDFDLSGNAIITGPNASGKSTFMKAVAINTIMARTINTCTATRFTVSNIGVMTCMSLRDDVLSGDSYYLCEAKYVQRILMEVENNKDMLIVIDEIFKGTNTAERIAASKAILNFIGKTGCLAMVATHDMELATDSDFEKYYFDTQIQDKEVVFDYRIHEGISKSANAIALLRCLDYPDIVIREAQENIKKGKVG
ncbi:MutS domain V [Pseudobutyrivibrio sp. YE44]|uniref:MutS-related protein n=1 Tax=Pseudobutyrivibrio sp. YE44 TaxID=1520802 RepID=UPI00088C5FB8|nr:hypothetical protein [Pseudobutyrivibrio sp. YE44]SDB21386.1 MutS domain V [Pseudobutyrivibrio sp. YE44]